ncbi:MAG: oligosaccharide repeat unit polymerase [Clostridia bacterium]|nr:oligosaccharide repeat unit polymerase [Clostridia bacterium]
MLVILLALLTTAYFWGKRDLLSPWFLLCLAILASYLIVLLNYNNWDVKINGTFVLYITTALISFGIGAFVVKIFSPSKLVTATHLERVSLKKELPSKRYPEIFFIVVSVIAAVLYCWKVLSDVGGSGSISERIRHIYDSVVGGYSPGFVFNQCLELTFAIAYINVYRLFQEIYSRCRVISILNLLIPILVFIVVIMVSSDRNIFLRFAIYFICLFVLFFRENSKKRNVNKSIVFKVSILLLILVIIFFLLGKSKQYSSGIFKSVSIYGGSGLYDFNLWIADFDQSLLHGQSTFSVFITMFNSIFGRFGFVLPNANIDRIDEFIEFSASNGYVFSSNIYTALRPYVEDFGYFGVILFPFIIGMFYQWLFVKMKKSKYGYNWILYCMLIYPIVFFPILEQLIRRFHLGFIYEIAWVAIVYHLVYGNKVVRIQEMGTAKQVTKTAQNGGV